MTPQKIRSLIPDFLVNIHVYIHFVPAGFQEIHFLTFQFPEKGTYSSFSSQSRSEVQKLHFSEGLMEGAKHTHISNFKFLCGFEANSNFFNLFGIR